MTSRDHFTLSCILLDHMISHVLCKVLRVIIYSERQKLRSFLEVFYRPVQVQDHYHYRLRLFSIQCWVQSHPGLYGRTFVHMSTSVHILKFLMVRRLNPSMRRTIHGKKSVHSSTSKLIPLSVVRICPWDLSVVYMDGWTADGRLRPWRPGLTHILPNHES